MTPPADPSLYTVTVVVPAYNASATLGRALQSALAQTHRAVEVIVVDDASADGTLQVAREFAAGDRRVRIVERPQNSGGVGAPRNNGIMAATGQYVMFLDADDELPLKACETLLQSALTTGADITAGRALRVNLAKDEITVWQSQLYGTDRTVEGGLRAMPELLQDPIAAAKLYRLDFLLNHGIRFPEELFFEDTYFSTVAWYSARSVTLLAAPVYRWIWERETDTPPLPTGAANCAASATGSGCTSTRTRSSSSRASRNCSPTRRPSSSRTTCGSTRPNCGRATRSSGPDSPASWRRTSDPCRPRSTTCAARWSAYGPSA